MLRGPRRVHRWNVVASSRRLTWPSIQPKHNASSNAWS